MATDIPSLGCGWHSDVSCNLHMHVLQVLIIIQPDHTVCNIVIVTDYCQLSIVTWG